MTIDEALLKQCLHEAMMEVAETNYRLMQTERNRWRLCAIQLAEQLYKRLPNLPDLEYFYELLDETDERD
jgi:hypothetical protein